MNAPNAHIGIIGGSGLYQMPNLRNIQEVRIATPFGDPSDAIIIGDLEACPVAFLPRHGRGHVLIPSEIPYQANIYALKKLGVQHIISVSACGSLREHLHPGDVIVPDQLVDFTKLRRSSFFSKGCVAHISTAEPFCPTLSKLLVETLKETCDGLGVDAAIHRGGQYIAIEGPRFSTKSESRLFRTWGMDIIGMTASPEAFLAREAGLCYATMAHVTDYDVWHESEEVVTVDKVIQQLNRNLDLARETVRLLVTRLAEAPTTCDCRHALDDAIITAPGHIPPEIKARLQLLLEG